MPRRDGVSDMRATSLLSPINRVADADSVGLDVVDGDSAELLIQFGANVNAGVVVAIEEADLLAGPYTVVDADLDLIGDTVPAPPLVDTTYRVGYVGNKQFVRASLTIPASTDVGVNGLNGDMHKTPEPVV
jgi:hypothetical protein